MPYAVVADIRKLLPQISITPTSKPLEADVTTWLDEAEKELNLILRNLGYDTPVTDATDLVTVRDMVTHKVGARVLRAKVFGIGDVNTSGAKDLDAFYDVRIKWLGDDKHPFELANTTRNGREVVKPGGLVRGFMPESADATDADDTASQARAFMSKVF